MRQGKANRFLSGFSHDLVEIDGCLIADNALNKVIPPLGSWINELDTPIEYVEVVTGDEPNEIVAAGKIAGDFIPRDDSACEHLIDQANGINGLILYAENWRKEWGHTAVSIRSDDGICLKVKGDVFTQINAEGNRKLLSELLAAGGFDKNDQVLELYAGAGNFTLSIAKQAREVVAVESYRQSVDSGKRSAQFNGIANIRWICAHVPAAVERFSSSESAFLRLFSTRPAPEPKGLSATWLP